MERADIRSSHDWLNKTDHPELRTYAPIFAAQVPDDHLMFPDPRSVLVMEPDLLGLTPAHDVLGLRHVRLFYSDGTYDADLWLPASRDALLNPWNGNKDRDQYRLDSAERITKLRSDWTQYLASYRTIADMLEADDAPYPTAPYVQREAKVEFGSEHELYSGQPAYSPDAPGKVSVRDRTLGRDGFNTQCVMQRTQIAYGATNKMAQELLSPLYGMHGPFKPDEKYARAWKKGYDAAHGDAARSASSTTSRLRGEYARRAARAYHNAYLKAYHEWQ